VTAPAVSLNGTQPTAGLPPVHALVLNYNGWPHTIECLESLMRVEYPALRIIVCDNGSTDDSWTRLLDWASGTSVPATSASPALRHLSHPPTPKPITYGHLTREDAERGAELPAETRFLFIQNGENLGFTGGNNVGLRYFLASAACGYVWLLNNDMVVAPDALRQMIELAESDHTIAAVGATLFEYSDPDVVQEAGGGQLTGWHGLVKSNDVGARRGARLGLTKLDYVSGGCMVIRRAALEQVGLLDERFFIYGEDLDWCVRPRSRGFTLGYAAAANIWHKRSATTSRRAAFYDYHQVRSAFLFVDKHSPRMLPIAMAHGVYRFVLPKLMRGEWTRLKAVVRGYADFRQESARAARAGR
jgi:GT2 family glycosyltransferase